LNSTPISSLVWNDPKARTGRGDVVVDALDTVNWPMPAHGPVSTLTGRGVLPFDLLLGRGDAYADRVAKREAEDGRRRFVGTYAVVEALDYLRRATPAAIFKLAAASSSAASAASSSRKKRGEGKAGNAREGEEGPDWLGHEAIKAAEGWMRPSAPAWTILGPIEVTQPKKARSIHWSPYDPVGVVNTDP